MQCFITMVKYFMFKNGGKENKELFRVLHPEDTRSGLEKEAETGSRRTGHTLCFGWL